MPDNYSSPFAETPSGRLPVMAEDPFNAQQIQFGVLADMGYPVTLETATMADEYRDRREIEVQDQDEAASLSHEATWKTRDAQLLGARLLRPVVLDSDFAAYASELSMGENLNGEIVPELFEITSLQLDNLRRHPGPRLTEAVSSGSPTEVAQYIKDIRQHGPPKTAHPTPPRIMPIAAASYVRAMDRFLAGFGSYGMSAAGPLLSNVTRHDAARYNDLMKRNVQPIGAEALAGLVQDFYTMVEHYMPAFTRFRNRPSA